MIRQGGARQGKVRQGKARWGQDWSEQDFVGGSYLLKQQKPCQGFIKILSRVWCLLNLGKVLGKIWAGVMALTVRNHTRIDMGSRSSRVWDMKFIKSILAVVEEMKGFLNREITFPINVVLEKWRTVLSIKFGIQNTIDIPNSIIILSNNRLLRFLPLVRQGVGGYMAQERGMEYWMDFHECRKFKLNYQRVLFKDMLNQKRINISVI